MFSSLSLSAAIRRSARARPGAGPAGPGVVHFLQALARVSRPFPSQTAAPPLSGQLPRFGFHLLWQLPAPARLGSAGSWLPAGSAPCRRPAPARYSGPWRERPGWRVSTPRLRLSPPAASPALRSRVLGPVLQYAVVRHRCLSLFVG